MRGFTAEELEQATGFDRRTIAYYVQEGLLPKVGRRGPRTRYPRFVMDRLLFIRRVREAEEAGEISAISLSELRLLFDAVSPKAIARVAEGLWPVAQAIGEIARERYRRPHDRQMARDAAWSAMDAFETPTRLEFRDVPSSRASALAEEEKRSVDLASAQSDSRSLTEFSLDLPGKQDRNLADVLENRAAYKRSRDLPDRQDRQSDQPDSERMAYRAPEPGPDDPAMWPQPEAMRASATENEDPESGGLAAALSELQSLVGRASESDSGAVDRWSRVEISPGITLSVRGIAEGDAALLESVARRLRELIHRD